MKNNKKLLPAVIAVFVAALCLVIALVWDRNGKETYDVVFFGDSIIAGWNAEKPIPSRFEELSGLKTFNAAFGGMTMARSSELSGSGSGSYLFTMAGLSESLAVRDFSKQLMALDEDNIYEIGYWSEKTQELSNIDWDSVRYVVIEQGTNDYNEGIALDDPDDPYNTGTFGGALRTVIKNIKKGAPNAEIIIMTPLYCYIQGADGDCTEVSFGGGLLSEYADKEIEIADESGILIMDDYRNSGINADNYTDYIYDGLHTNGEGDALIADLLWNFISEYGQ